MEEWRDVPGYECRVSADGAVHGKTKVLKPWSDHDGYLRVTVYPVGDSRQKQVPVHTLICFAFHGPRPTAEHEAAHWDGNRQNNVKANLRWATPKEQAADRTRHGRTYAGESHPNARLTEAQVAEIRSAYPGATLTALALRFKVTPQMIWRIVNGRAWRIAA